MAMAGLSRSWWSPYICFSGKSMSECWDLITLKKKNKQTDLHRGKMFGTSTPDKIPLWGKRKQQQQEDSRPGVADLGNLSGHEFSPWQTVGKEASPYTHAIPSYGKGTYTSWTPGTWTASKWFLQRNTLGTPTTETKRRAIRTLQHPYGGDHLST